MILTALLLLLQQTRQQAPMLAEVLKLPPAEASDLVLRNDAHGRIISVEEVKEDRSRLQAPNVVELHLLEEPAKSRAGCSRTRWTAIFQGQAGQPIGKAVVTSTFNTTEIKLVTAGRCGSDAYVHLNPRLDKEAGFAALAWLERLRRGAGDERFACSDETQSGLCKDVGNIQRELTALRPWAVSRGKDHIELWLGVPGQVVTAVRFRPERQEFVEIDRRVPAPF